METIVFFAEYSSISFTASSVDTINDGTEIKDTQEKSTNTYNNLTVPRPTQERWTNTCSDLTVSRSKRMADKCIITNEFYSMKNDPYPVFCSQCLVHLDPPPIAQICKQMTYCPPFISEVLSPPRSTDTNQPVTNPKETSPIEPPQSERTDNNASESVSSLEFKKLEKKLRILERKLKKNSKVTAPANNCCSFQHSNNYYPGPYQNPFQPEVMFQFMNKMMALNDRQRETKVPSRKRKREPSICRANRSRAKSKKKKRKIDKTTSTWDVETVSCRDELVSLTDATNGLESSQTFTHSLPTTETLLSGKELVSLIDDSNRQEYSPAFTNSLLKNNPTEELLNDDTNSLENSEAFMHSLKSTKVLPFRKEPVSITDDINYRECSAFRTNSSLRNDSNEEVVSAKEPVLLTDDAYNREYSALGTNSLLRNESNKEVISGKELFPFTDNRECSASRTNSLLRDESNKEVVSGKEVLSLTDDTNNREGSALSTNSLLVNESTKEMLLGGELMSLNEDTNGLENSEAFIHSQPSTQILPSGKEPMSLTYNSTDPEYSEVFTNLSLTNNSTPLVHNKLQRSTELCCKSDSKVSIGRKRQRSHGSFVSTETNDLKKDSDAGRILHEVVNKDSAISSEKERSESNDSFVSSETSDLEKNSSADRISCVTKSQIESEESCDSSRKSVVKKRWESHDDFVSIETSESEENPTADRILFSKKSQVGNEESTMSKEGDENHDTVISTETNNLGKYSAAARIMFVGESQAGNEDRKISITKERRKSHGNFISIESRDSKRNCTAGRILFVKDSQTESEKRTGLLEIIQRQGHGNFTSAETSGSEKNVMTDKILCVKESQAGSEKRTASNENKQRESHDNFGSIEPSASYKHLTADRMIFVKESRAGNEERNTTNAKELQESNDNCISIETSNSENNIAADRILFVKESQAENEKQTMSDYKEHRESSDNFIPTETNRLEEDVTPAKISGVTKSETESEKSNEKSGISSSELTCSSSDESTAHQDRNENLSDVAIKSAKRSARRPLKKSRIPNKKSKNFISSLFCEDSQGSDSDELILKQRVQEKIENTKVKTSVTSVPDTDIIHIPSKKHRIAHVSRVQENVNVEIPKNAISQRITVKKEPIHSHNRRMSVCENSTNICGVLESKIGPTSAIKTVTTNTINETKKELAYKKSECTEKLKNVIAADKITAKSTICDFHELKKTVTTTEEISRTESVNTELSKRLREEFVCAVDFDHGYHLSVPNPLKTFEKVLKPAVDFHDEISSNKRITDSGENNQEKDSIDWLGGANDTIRRDIVKSLPSRSISKIGAEPNVDENSILQQSDTGMQNCSNSAVQSLRIRQVQNVTPSPVRELRSRRVILSPNKNSDIRNFEVPQIQKSVVSRNVMQPGDNHGGSEQYFSPIAVLDEILKGNERRNLRRNSHFHKQAVEQHWLQKGKLVITELSRLADDSEWSSAVLWSVIERISTCSNPRIIAMSVVNFLCERALNNEKLDNTHTPPAPLMTKTQQRISTLLAMLNRTMPSIMQLVQAGIEYKLFRLSHSCQTKVAEELVRMFTVLARIQKDREKVRILCCDSLYCLGLQAIPLIYVVLTCWPEVFPIAGSNEEPLVRCIVHLLMSQKADGDYPKLVPLKNLLLTYYRYPTDGYVSKNLIADFMTAFKERQKNLDTAIILLAKRERPNWAYKNVIQGGLLQIVFQNAHPSPYDAFCLLGNILRTFPLKDESGIVKNIMNQLRNIMELEGSAEQREGAACALISLSRHKLRVVASAILKWKSSEPLRMSTLQQLRLLFQAASSTWWNKLRPKTCPP